MRAKKLREKAPPLIHNYVVSFHSRVFAHSLVGFLFLAGGALVLSSHRGEWVSEWGGVRLIHHSLAFCQSLCLDTTGLAYYSFTPSESISPVHHAQTVFLQQCEIFETSSRSDLEGFDTANGRLGDILTLFRKSITTERQSRYHVAERTSECMPHDLPLLPLSRCCFFYLICPPRTLLFAKKSSIEF